MPYLGATCETCRRRIRLHSDDEKWRHVRTLPPSGGWGHEAWPKRVPHGPHDDADALLTYEDFKRLLGQPGPHPVVNKNRLSREVEQLERRLALMRKFALEDPYEDGDVLAFIRRLGGKDYQYAALRAAGRWWITGVKERSWRSWDDLVAWLTDGKLVGDVWHVHTWEKMS